MLRELFSRRRLTGPSRHASGPLVLSIGHVVPGAKDRLGALSVTNLREALLELAKAGYTVYALRDLAEKVFSAASEGTPESSEGLDHAVGLAVEGGCSCQREYVLPLLRAMRLPHTLFVNPSKLGKQDAMTRDDARVVCTEGTPLGGLWDAEEGLDELGTMEAAWNLEILAHEVLALVHPEGPRPAPCEEEPWLCVTSGEGGNRVLALARAAGFRGILDGYRVAGRHHLPRRQLLPPKPPRRWKGGNHNAFQGACSARR
jgi:hypothetical protein